MVAKVRLDFTDVEEKKVARHIEPGDYAAKVLEATSGKSGNKGTPQVVFKYQITSGSAKGSNVYHNCNLLPQSLWVLRNALEAMGFSIPKKQIQLDLAKCVGKTLAITVEDDEYDGKLRSRVVDTFSIDELKAGSKKASDDDDEDLGTDDDEDDEDEEEEDLEEVDLDDV